MARNHILFLVGVEIDADRPPGPDDPATTLDRNGAEQLLAHLATDLAALIPGARRHALAMAGALYDPTDVLRPGLPLFASLAELHKQAGEDAPKLLSAGADEGRFPVPGLQPRSDVPRGALQLLPLLLSGPEQGLRSLGEEMEYRFMEEGQLSAQSAAAVEAGFRLPTAHARFMTLTDLKAMLRLQFEHFGFLPLWELLDAALNGDPAPLDLRGAGGQRFCWAGDRVRARFETFDHWAVSGGGAGLPDDADLPGAYADWTREYRQYLVTLDAHGVPLDLHLPGSEAPLDGSFLVEDAGPAADAGNAAAITEHTCGDVGTIAVTVIDNGRLLHYYPLLPHGVDELHARIGTARTDVGVSFPGTIVHDPGTRRLTPDRMPDEAPAGSA